MKDNAALDALARALAEKVSRNRRPVSANDPDFSAPNTGNDGWDETTRVLCIQRIRLLVRAYQLDWLVQQHLLTKPSIESLTNRQLRLLLGDAEQAREAISEGFPLEQTGLIRDITHQLPDA